MSKLIKSSLLFGISLLIKPQAILLTPLILIYLLKNFNLKTVLKLILPAAFTLIIFSLPFFPKNPLEGIFKLIYQMSLDYKANSLFAYNLWGILGFWIDDSTKWIFLSYKNLGISLLGIYWLLISFLYFKKRLSLYTAAALASLAFFFLPTRVHERYLYPAIPLLIVAACEFRSYIVWLLIASLSLIHLLNLYYVYVYYNEIYLGLNKVLYLGFLYNFLDHQARLLSIASTAIFIFISFYLIRLNYDKKIV